MNELQLSSDLNVITAEINSYKQVAGQAIFEIGRRLKHVKENDLVHGEWTRYCEQTLDMTIGYANRYIRVYEEFGDTNMYTSIGLNQLYHIATLPEEEREKEHTLSSGETKTVDEMVEREHGNVMKDIRRIIEHLGQVKSYESYFILNYLHTHNANLLFELFTHSCRLLGKLSLCISPRFIETIHILT